MPKSENTSFFRTAYNRLNEKNKKTAKETYMHLFAVSEKTFYSHLDAWKDLSPINKIQLRRAIGLKAAKPIQLFVKS